MIGTLAPILLQSDSAWSARDIIISDMFEIIESQDMLACYQSFFEDDVADHEEDDSSHMEAKFQMCEPRTDFLTSASDEQYYVARNS